MQDLAASEAIAVSVAITVSLQEVLHLVPDPLVVVRLIVRVHHLEAPPSVLVHHSVPVHHLAAALLSDPAHHLAAPHSEAPHSEAPHSVALHLALALLIIKVVQPLMVVTSKLL